MTRRTKPEALHDKNAAVRAAEAAGEVADSMPVRLEIVRRMNAGEITLAQAQAELAAIKRGAAKAGKTTRGKVWRSS